MKTKSLFLAFVTLFFMVSCSNNDEFETVNVANAEYMTLEAFRLSVDIIAPTPIIESGKIYAYNNLVLVNGSEEITKETMILGNKSGVIDGTISVTPDFN